MIALADVLSILFDHSDRDCYRVRSQNVSISDEHAIFQEAHFSTGSSTYNPGSFTASVVIRVLDSLSAGILIYTGLVELLARDFLFNPTRTKDNKRLAFMVACVFLGAILMALLGKWA